MFLLCQLIARFNLKGFSLIYLPPWSRSKLLIFPANWHSGVNQCLEIDPHLDPLKYLEQSKDVLESYSALRLDKEDSRGYKML